MANEILIPILESVKTRDGKPFYCCIKQWLIAHRHVRSGELASAWGLSKSTIKYWRRKLRAGDLPCDRSPHCKMNRTSTSLPESEAPDPDSSC